MLQQTYSNSSLSNLISKNIDKFFYLSSFCCLSKSLHMLYVNRVCYFLLSQIPLPTRGRSRLPLTSATRVKSAASWTSTLRMPPWTKVRPAQIWWLESRFSATVPPWEEFREKFWWMFWEGTHVSEYVCMRCTYTPTPAPAASPHELEIEFEIKCLCQGCIRISLWGKSSSN